MMWGEKGKVSEEGRSCQNAAGAGETFVPPPRPRGPSGGAGSRAGAKALPPVSGRAGQAGPGRGLEGGPDSSQPSAQKWFDIITMTTAAYEHTNNRDEIDKRLACHEKYNKFLI